MDHPRGDPPPGPSRLEQALEAEDLLISALERAEALQRRLVLDGDDDLTPLLLAVSDNGSQMIAASTRRFMAMVAIAQHFGRPATRTDQAWIESLNGTLHQVSSDDVEGSLSWDRRSIPMSCASAPRGRALEALADPARAKGAIRRIADELGVHPEALRSWVKKAQVGGGLRPGTTTDEAQRIKESALEVQELRGANAILKSASACLSRRSVT